MNRHIIMCCCVLLFKHIQKKKEEKKFSIQNNRNNERQTKFIGSFISSEVNHAKSIHQMTKSILGLSQHAEDIIL